MLEFSLNIYIYVVYQNSPQKGFWTGTESSFFLSLLISSQTKKAMFNTIQKKKKWYITQKVAASRHTRARAVSRTQNGGSVGKARSLWQWPLRPWAWSSLRARRTAMSWPFMSVASSGLWFCSAGAWGCPVPPAGRSTAPVEDAGNAWPSSARCGGRRLAGCHEGCEQRGKEDDSPLGRSITCCLVSFSQVPCWAGVKLKWELSPFQGVQSVKSNSLSSEKGDVYYQPFKGLGVKQWLKQLDVFEDFLLNAMGSSWEKKKKKSRKTCIQSVGK